MVGKNVCVCLGLGYQISFLYMLHVKLEFSLFYLGYMILKIVNQITPSDPRLNEI